MHFSGRGAVTSPGIAYAVMGDSYIVTTSEQIAGRFDTKAARDFLGPIASRFEVAILSTVVRIKPAARTLSVVMAAA